MADQIKTTTGGSYQKYIDTQTLAASSTLDMSPSLPLMPLQGSLSGPDLVNLPPMPHSSQLRVLKSELETMLSTTESRISDIKSNYEILKTWLKKYDPAGIAAKEVEKDKKAKLIKLKIKDGSAEGSSATRTSFQATNVDLPASLLRKRQAEEMDSTIAKAGGENGQMKVAITQNGIIKITPPSLVNTMESSASSQRMDYGVKPLEAAKGAKARSGRGGRGSKAKKDKMKRRFTEDHSSSNRGTPEPDATVVMDGDYSKAKAPSHQIPVAQFWTFCEQYFRNITPEDLKLLEPDTDQSWFQIPPLDEHYSKQWEEEDVRLSSMFDENAAAHGIHSSALTQSSNVEYVQMEDTVFGGDVRMGKYEQRLVAALCREGQGATGLVPDLKSRDAMDDDDFFSPVTPSPTALTPGSSFPRSKSDVASLEKRIRHELLYLGLLDDGDISSEEPAPNTEDDEITFELKRAQEDLRLQMASNQAKKDRLKQIAEKYVGWQEYNSLLDEINKNIEQSYIKRHKSNNKGKGRKKQKQENGPIPESVIHALEARQRLIREVGDVFFPRERFQVPTESIYKDLEKDSFEPSVNQVNGNHASSVGAGSS